MVCSDKFSEQRDASGAGDLDFSESSGLDAVVRFKVDDDVVVGSSGPAQFVACADSFCEDGHGLADLCLAHLSVYLKLVAHEDVESVELYLFVDLILHGVCGGAFLARVGEDSCAVKFRFVDEVAKLLEVGLGLAGETDDEGGSDDDVGYLTTKLFDDAFDHGAVASSVHGLQHSVGDVLKGHVDIFDDTVVVSDLGDKLVGYLVRVAVEKTEPRN